MKKYIIVAVVLILLVGTGGYYFMTRQNIASEHGAGHEAKSDPIAQSPRSYEAEITSHQKTNNLSI